MWLNWSQFAVNRHYRNCRVGHANCIIKLSEDALLGDIWILDNIPFDSINDKLYRLVNWHEPSNYQKRGLGTMLLQEIINFAKSSQVKKLHGSLTQEDLSKNPNLIKCYQKHGFRIEKPTLDEVDLAGYRVCLYFD